MFVSKIVMGTAISINVYENQQINQYNQKKVLQHYLPDITKYKQIPRFKMFIKGY